MLVPQAILAVKLLGNTSKTRIILLIKKERTLLTEVPRAASLSGLKSLSFPHPVLIFMRANLETAKRAMVNSNPEARVQSQPRALGDFKRT